MKLHYSKTTILSYHKNLMFFTFKFQVRRDIVSNRIKSFTVTEKYFSFDLFLGICINILHVFTENLNSELENIQKKLKSTQKFSTFFVHLIIYNRPPFSWAKSPRTNLKIYYYFTLAFMNSCRIAEHIEMKDCFLFKIHNLSAHNTKVQKVIY